MNGLTNKVEMQLQEVRGPWKRKRNSERLVF